MTDIDSDDQDDADQTEAAVAAALVAEFVPGATVAGALGDLARRIRDSAGGALQQYAVRVIDRFLQATGRSKDADYLDMEEPATEAVDAVVDDAARAVNEILDADSRTETKGGSLDDEDDPYRRMRVGMEALARIAVTQAREEAKKSLATRMGATGRVWHTKRDGRVRISHADLEGEFQRIGVPFVTINDAELQYPGDPTAPLNERLGCRCRLAWRTT